MQMIKLLANAKTTAVQLRDDVATMQSFNQLDIKWEEHAETVAQMREHVMAMNEQAAQLKADEQKAEPWEKAVIDRIEPYMTTLAGDNEAAMDKFDEHPSIFGTPAAGAYLAADAESANFLTGLIVNFIENGTLRQTIEDYDEQEDGCGLTGVAYRPEGMAS